MSDYTPLPGTNRDVWAFGNPLFTIATYYPGLTDQAGGIAGTECFYFDYYKAAVEAIKALKIRIESGDYEFTSNTGKMKYNELGGQLTLDLTAASDRWTWMATAWIQRSRMTGSKPRMSVFDPLFYRMLEEGWIEYDGKTFQLIRSLARNPYPPFSRVEDEYDKIHPLSHFPILEGTSVLNDAVFFDPVDPFTFQEKIFDWYNRSNASTIVNYCQSRGRKITYADLITPQGYGFIVNLSAIGLNIQYSIPFDDWVITHRRLNIQAKAGRLETTRYTYGPRRGETIYNVEIDNWGRNTRQAIAAWDERDRWIQSWLAGGPIPLDGIFTIYNGYPIFTKTCDYLESLYPIDIKHKSPDVWDSLFEAVFILASVGYSAASGNIGGIIRQVTTMIAPVLQSAFPKIANLIRFGTMAFTAGVINKNFGAPDKKMKTADTLLSMAGGIITSGRDQMNVQSMVDSMINNLDEERQVPILTAISEQRDRAARDTTMKLQLATNNLEFARPEIKKAEVEKILWQKAEDDKAGSLLTTGALIVGGAILLKYLKGK